MFFRFFGARTSIFIKWLVWLFSTTAIFHRPSAWITASNASSGFTSSSEGFFCRSMASAETAPTTSDARGAGLKQSFKKNGHLMGRTKGRTPYWLHLPCLSYDDNKMVNIGHIGYIYMIWVYIKIGRPPKDSLEEEK